MTETWRIRHAREGDALTIVRHRYPEPQGKHLELYASWVARAISRGIYLGWLAEAEGTVVAGAGLVLLEWGPTPEDPNPVRGRIGNVYTEPSWRRRGLATALLQRCLADANVRGVSVLNLSTTPQARALYERLGFEASGTEMVRVTLRSRRSGKGVR